MTTASPAFDGIRVRAAQTGLYETPILHGRLADVTALSAALGSVICDRHAQPRELQCRWLVLATDMLDWGGALADTALRGETSLIFRRSLSSVIRMNG